MLNARLYYFICLAILAGGVGFLVDSSDAVVHPGPVQYDSIEYPGYWILLNPDHSLQVYQGDKESFTGTRGNSNGKLFLNGAYFTFVLTVQGDEKRTKVISQEIK